MKPRKGRATNGRPAPVVGKTIRRCPLCDAAPGWRCRSIKTDEPMKSVHKERKAP